MTWHSFRSIVSCSVSLSLYASCCFCCWWYPGLIHSSQMGCRVFFQFPRIWWDLFCVLWSTGENSWLLRRRYILWSFGSVISVTFSCFIVSISSSNALFLFLLESVGCSSFPLSLCEGQNVMVAVVVFLFVCLRKRWCCVCHIDVRNCNVAMVDFSFDENVVSFAMCFP